MPFMPNDGGFSSPKRYSTDSALGVAFDFYRQHPDETLIVVTADPRYRRYGLCARAAAARAAPKNIDYQRISKEEFSEHRKAIQIAQYLHMGR